jgi:hypothetical protein
VVGSDHQLQKLRRHFREQIVIEFFLPIILLAGRETRDVPFVKDGTAPQALELLSQLGGMDLNTRGRLRRDGGFQEQRKDSEPAKTGHHDLGNEPETPFGEKPTFAPFEAEAFARSTMAENITFSADPTLGIGRKGGRQPGNPIARIDSLLCAY